MLPDPHRRSPRLPIEVCEVMFSHIWNWNTDWNDRRNSTLLACMLTCREWYPRANRLLYVGEGSVRFSSLPHVDGFVQRVLEWPESGHAIIFDYWGKKPRTLLGPAPLKLTKCRDSIASMRIENNFENQVFHLGKATHPTQFLMACATYRSLNRLELEMVKISTFGFFTRFLLCFPSLQDLNLESVMWHAIGAYSLSMAKRKPLQLRRLKISQAHSEPLYSWLLQIQAVRPCETLNLEFNTESYSDAVRLIHASAASLKSLDIWPQGASAWESCTCFLP